MKQQQMDLGKDPKTMVTPKAFTIAAAVLYTPLATPLKRMLAILIDGLLITVLAEQMDWMLSCWWSVLSGLKSAVVSLVVY